MSAQLKDRKPKAPSVVTIRPALLARADAALYLSISERNLAQLVTQNKLAKPRLISANRVGWLVADLDAFAASRPMADLLPPENAGYGRAGKPE